jgi:DinB superfamily
MPTDEAVKSALKNQLHAALAMLREAIERCPDDLWDSDVHRNRCWQVAYHVIMITDFYMGRDEASFQPWSGHRAGSQYPDGIPGPADPESTLPLIPDPYSKAEVLDYWKVCDDAVDAAVDDLDLERTECGFPWYPLPKLEHVLLTLRHAQHHAAQLADRVRQAADVGVPWVGSGRSVQREAS